MLRVMLGDLSRLSKLHFAAVRGEASMLVRESSPYYEWEGR